MNRRFLTAALVASIAAALNAQTTRLVPGQFSTIQTAINVCLNGDDVLVAPGVYPGAINFLGKSITVHSSGGAAVTTIQGSTGARVVTFSANEGPGSVLQGFTVAGGSGGIFIQNASPQISSCVISGNSVTPYAPFGATFTPTQILGGGIYCFANAGISSPVVSNCVISGNSAWQGGGIYMEAGTTLFPTLTGCTIENNVAQSGQFCQASVCSVYNGDGAGACFKGSGCSPTITGCTFRENAGMHQGAGVAFLGNGTASVTSCRILDNVSVTQTGGISSQDTAQLTMTNCLIARNVSQNPAPNVAGGFSSTGGFSVPMTVTVKVCTIAENHTSGLAGGMLVAHGASSTVTITSSLLWGNDILDLQNLGLATPNVSYSDIEGAAFPGAGNISADPLLAESPDGDLHIAALSPCRNAGTPNTAGFPATDLDGSPRIAGAAVDIGADEIPSFTFPGTPDGLDLDAWVNGLGDPLASTRAAVANDLLTVRMVSPNGVLVGGLPLFAARLYFTGNPFAVPGGGIWLDGQSVIVYGALSAPPFGFPGLPPQGLEFSFTVPAGLAGHTVRMQGLVSSGNALNGIYATSNATEVTF